MLHIENTKTDSFCNDGDFLKLCNDGNQLASQNILQLISFIQNLLLKCGA